MATKWTIFLRPYEKPVYIHWCHEMNTEDIQKGKEAICPVCKAKYYEERRETHGKKQIEG